jgi:hypothetical protein
VEAAALLFFVEPLRDGCFFPAVSVVPPLKVKPRSPIKVTSANRIFWARPANAELDRSGEWLLSNLSTTRARVATRAGPV